DLEAESDRAATLVRAWIRNEVERNAIAGMECELDRARRTGRQPLPSVPYAEPVDADDDVRGARPDGTRRQAPPELRVARFGRAAHRGVANRRATVEVH